VGKCKAALHHLPLSQHNIGYKSSHGIVVVLAWRGPTPAFLPVGGLLRAGRIYTVLITPGRSVGTAALRQRKT
jgi:hypothetical protein